MTCINCGPQTVRDYQLSRISYYRLSDLINQAAKATATGLHALSAGMAAAVALDNQKDTEVGGPGRAAALLLSSVH
jgi:hypothetical protein